MGIDLHRARINTAGAYVVVNGFYLFTMGIRPHDGKIPIVRLGGHREEDETGWQCARREVHEEAGLQIKPLPTERTFLTDWGHMESELQEVVWQPELEKEPQPLLIVRNCQEEVVSLSLMYLAQAEGTPRPSSEVKGLLLLTKEEVHRLCQGPLTLEEYLSNGGRAICSAEFDIKLVLEPFIQLRLLSKILALEINER